MTHTGEHMPLREVFNAESFQRLNISPEDLKIIFVGPDCGGKTSIADRVKSFLGLGKEPRRLRIKDDLEMIQRVTDIVRGIDNASPFVWDQFYYPVDIIYRGALGEGNSPLEPFASIFTEHLNSSGVLFIHVFASEDELRERYAERGDDLYDIEQIVKVAKSYKPELIRLGVNFHNLDTTGKSLDNAVAEALSLIIMHTKQRKGNL